MRGEPLNCGRETVMMWLKILNYKSFVLSGMWLKMLEGETT
jgi:hypothetical protein